jgi:hypothetical protein
MLKIVTLFCLISGNAFAGQQCIVAAETINQEYNDNIENVNRQKNLDMDAENMSFKSKVNGMYFNHEKNHTPEHIYNKNIEQERIYHNNNLRIIIERHKNNTELLNNGLKNDLKKIQNGNC